MTLEEPHFSAISHSNKIGSSIKNADDETKRRILELVQTRVDVLGPYKIVINCLIQSGQIVDLSTVENLQKRLKNLWRG